MSLTRRRSHLPMRRSFIRYVMPKLVGVAVKAYLHLLDVTYEWIPVEGSASKWEFTARPAAERSIAARWRCHGPASVRPSPTCSTWSDRAGRAGAYGRTRPSTGCAWTSRFVPRLRPVENRHRSGGNQSTTGDRWIKKLIL